MRHPVVGLHTEVKGDYLDVRFDLQLLLLIHKYVYSGKDLTAGAGIKR